MKFFILSFISILFFGCTNSDKKIDLNDYNRLITQTKSLIAKKSYKNAIIKCDVALEITDTLSEAFLYKGISLMHLNEFEDAVLLCSEPTAKQCHRRLASEYLLKHFGNINIKHL